MKLNCSQGIGTPENYFIELCKDADFQKEAGEFAVANPPLPVYTTTGELYMGEAQMEGEMVWQFDSTLGWVDAHKVYYERHNNDFSKFSESHKDVRQIYRISPVSEVVEPVEGEDIHSKKLATVFTPVLSSQHLYTEDEVRDIAISFSKYGVWTFDKWWEVTNLNKGKQ